MDGIQNPDVTTGDGQVSDGQQQAEAAKLGWRSELPDELKQHEAFTSYQSKKDLWKGHIDMAAKVKELDGRLADSIPKLAADATDEQRAAFWAALGRPESPDKYQFDKLEVPEGVTPDDSLDAWFRGVAHASGLTQEQAAGLRQAFNAVQVEAYKAQVAATEKARNDASEALKKEWGGDYDANIEVMRRAVEGFGGQEFKALMDSTGLGNNPVVIKVFHTIGKAMQEDGGLLGGGPSTPSTKPGMNYGQVDMAQFNTG